MLNCTCTLVSNQNATNFTQVKQKKQQRESERQSQVMAENLILLRHLSEISISKRVDDGNSCGGKDGSGKQIHWKDYFSSILLMRKQQVARLKRQLAEMERQAQEAGRLAGKKVEGHDKSEIEAVVKESGQDQVESAVKVEINGEEVVEGNGHDEIEEKQGEDETKEAEDKGDSVQVDNSEEGKSTDDFYD